MCYVFVVETVLPANAVSVMVAEFDIGWWRKCSSSRALVVNLLIAEATSTAQHASLVDYVSVLVIAERGSRWLNSKLAGGVSARHRERSWRMC